MATRKTSPPDPELEAEKKKKPETKTRPVARKAPAARKPRKSKTAAETNAKQAAETVKAVPPDASPSKTTGAKNASGKAAGLKQGAKRKATESDKSDDPVKDTSKKKRPVSPVNGVPLPEGKRFQTGEEAREKGRKGGKRSAEVRKERKTLRQELLDLLSEVVTDENGKAKTMNESISVALLGKALKGDVRAYEAIRDTIGEKPKEQVDVSVTAPQFDALDAAFASMGDAL